MPETKYAQASDGVYIAYQAFGEGDVTFVGAPGIISNVEVAWEDPEVADFLTRLGSFCRCVHFDKRGQGLSDRVAGVPTIEQRASDLQAVMDAEGLDRAVVGGISEGGTTAMFFAATHPERTLGLIVFGSFARVLEDVDYPGQPVKQNEKVSDIWAERWGRPDTITPALVAPDRVADRSWIDWLNRYERQSCSPSGFRAQLEWARELDIRAVVPLIEAPTLVIQRAGDRIATPAMGRWLADHIPNARYAEVAGNEHMPFFNIEGPLAEIEEFLTGHRPQPRVERVLATVLFTDIVGSTELASELGDHEWRGVLDRHDAMAARIVERFGGRVVKSTGDGLLATFTGPASGVRCAVELLGAAEQLGIRLRAGLHAGEVELRGDDVAGIAVHLAARVSGRAEGSEVLVTRTVKDLVAGSGIEFDDRGEHGLKGIPEPWQLLLVRSC